MKIKKLIIILMSLIMVFNIIIPTVALAVNEVNEKPDNNTVIENENISEDENFTTENDDDNIGKMNTTQNTTDVIENSEGSQENTNITNNIINEQTTEKNQNNIENQIETMEQTRGMIYLDSPTNGTIYYASETSNIEVRGWKMANDSNAYIRAFVDDTEIKSDEINYTQRPDVINTIKDYGTADQNPTPGFNFNIDTSGLESGEHTVRIDFYSGDTILATTSVTVSFDKELHVQYRTHVEEYGWQDYVQDGETAGTSGESLRLEAMNIQLVNSTDENINIKYQVHVQDIGWQDWKQNGEMAGTSNQSLRLEAIRIELENTEDYSIMYRVHVQDIGWQEWKTDGEMAGTSGQLLRLEAIEIKIVKKQKKGMLYLETPANGSTYYSSETSSISVSGWKMANTADASIRAYVDGTEIASESINYTQRPDVINAIKDYGTAEQNPTPGFNFSIDTASLDSGEHTIRIDLCYNGNVLATTSLTVNFDKELHVQYRTHVEEYGWQDYVQDGETAGTSGEGLRLEAMNIQLVNSTDENININIKYQVHVQDIGWQDWKQNGEMAGTSNQSLRLEAIRIELENTEDYSIMYRVHVQDIGWQEWKTDGEMAGTSGESLRLEAIEIKIVEKQKKTRLYVDTPANGTTYYNLETSNITVSGWKMANVSNTTIRAYVDDAEISSETINYTERTDVINAITDYGTPEQNPTPGFNFNVDTSNLGEGNHTIRIEVCYKDQVLETNNLTFYIDTAPHIRYSAHVEEIGWQDFMQDGAIAGTIGDALRIEALKIELINAPSTAHIKYRVYVQGTGWTDYVQDGEQVGTTGESKKIQAIEIEGLDGYVVEYQAHVQNIGWQPWAVDGMEAGTTERSFRIEALSIRIVKEENSVVPQVKYSAHNPTDGWIDYVENGAILGNENSELELDAIKVALENVTGANIKYTLHVRNIGWMDEVQNDAQAGTGNTDNGIEAIEIELEGLDDYSIEYRTYVIGEGWQNWVRDGVMSGTTGQDTRISAIQIRIVIKDDNRSFSNFEDLDESKYPGYKEKLQELQNQHPNWIITIDYTGLDWNTVLDNEDTLVGTSPKSLTQYGNQWKNGDTQYGTGWYRASRAAIAYMMDPRNSLDDGYVFQFQDLTSSAGTYDDIARMIEGTFLTKYQTSSTDSIINTILDSASEYNVSPYHLVSRMLQEQGTNGSSLNGYVYNGRTVYNLFNIGATGANDAEIIQNGAAYAYNSHWFTPETCIAGSARFLNTGYLSRGQSTLYYQKYNVVAEPYYSNQYMQNIRAANDEGKRISDEYKENGLINGEFEFTIPVYENMPATASPRPAT